MSALAYSPHPGEPLSSLSEAAALPAARLHQSRWLCTFNQQADASTKLAEAVKASDMPPDLPSRHLQAAIVALEAAIAEAGKAGVEAAEQESARLRFKELQEAEVKATTAWSKCPHWQCPCLAPVPPLSALAGSRQLDTLPGGEAWLLP